MKTIKGAQILMQNNKYFDFNDIESAEFSILEIAHALSNICRFGGHSNQFYSVAQHSVLVSYLVPEKHALAGLLHDAAEAFIGDLPTPLKALLPEYKKIENRVEAAIFKKFGLEQEKDPAIKQADLHALALEKRDLMPFNNDCWPMLYGIEPNKYIKLSAINNKDALILFMERFSEITTKGNQ